MSVRTRTRIEYGPGGLAIRSGVPYGHGPVPEKFESCTDDTAYGDNLNFRVEKSHYIGGRCNLAGDYDGVGGYGSFYNFMADGYRAFTFADGISHQYVPGDKGDVAYSTIAAARTNPSRPYVDVPVEVLQLGELTHLIRDSGRSIIKRAGNANLAYQFGIAPLVDDLFKLTNFRDQVKNRVKELQRLDSGRGLRRTIAIGGLDHLTASQSGYQGLVQSVYRLFYGANWTYDTTLEVGAHVRWSPDLTSMPMTNDTMHALAKKAVLGLTVDISTAWELVPWSWLVDWGSTCGAFLAASRNIIPAHPSEISVLRRTTTRYMSEGTTAVEDGFTRTLSPYEAHRVSKERNRVDYVAPVAYLPFLSANQMGIAASLSVTRA